MISNLAPLSPLPRQVTRSTHPSTCRSSHVPPGRMPKSSLFSLDRDRALRSGPPAESRRRPPRSHAPPSRYHAGSGGLLGTRDRSVVEAQPAQLFRIPLPVLGDLDAQVEVYPGAEQGLDLPPRAGADLLEPGALGADHDGLLAGALHVHHRMHVDEIVTPFPGSHLLDHDGDGVRQLVAHALEDRLADQLGDELLLWLIALLAVRVQRPPLCQARDEHVGPHAKLEAGYGGHRD